MKHLPPRRTTIGFRIAASVLSLLLTIAIVEGVLRLRAFTFEVAPIDFEFGWPDPVSFKKYYVQDRDLFWTQRRYRAWLDFLAESEADIFFLGDSTSEFESLIDTGNYPQPFLRRLNADFPGRKIRGAKLGVAGWSSYQGLQQLKRDVIPLHPKVVTLYFGWNDHWSGFAVPDRVIHQLLRSPWHCSSLRLCDLILKAQTGWARRGTERPIRVSPSEFRSNIQEMIAVARANDVIPVLLTAPTSIRQGEESQAALDGLAGRFMLDQSELVVLHARYVSIVRSIAAQEGVTLCDLASNFDALPHQRVSRELFMLDGIHLTPSGDELLAEFLHECFRGADDLNDLWL